MAVDFTTAESVQQCDERIENTDFYKNLVLSNETIEHLNQEWELSSSSINNCFVDNNLSIALRYDLPQDYSQYGIVYSTSLRAMYSKDGSISVILDTLNNESKEKSDYDKIVETFQNFITETETNSQIKEFIIKINPKEGHINSLFSKFDVSFSSNDQVFDQLGSPSSRIEYTKVTNSVREYKLTNSIEWDNFPIIKKAHDIIEEQLLNDEYSHCKIDKENVNSFTKVYGNSLSVDLTCTDGMKKASVYVYLDDSDSFIRYEALKVENVPLSNIYDLINYLISASSILVLVLLGIVIVAYFFIKSEKKSKK